MSARIAGCQAVEGDLNPVRAPPPPRPPGAGLMFRSGQKPVRAW